MDYAEYCIALRRSCGAEELPTDLNLIAKRLGVCVRERGWEGLPHAVSLRRPKLIVLNLRRPELSRRFDLAHELWHFLFRETYHSNLANLFASNLLMPKHEFLEIVHRCGEVNGEVSQTFLVSHQAALIRAEELHLISRS